ncbi:putative cytochrome P450 2D7 [Dissostichus eleginoides]|uniref:Cytochrome P450 2D7 n=1 Tax=Dissostichus eleginoides TaxID=100907 RepID=A0AAD9CMX4_DISEL|nr:putative cytochrome P450 2D7 [Dissostichus eleginoides]
MLAAYCGKPAENGGDDLMERLTTVMELFVLQSVRFTGLMEYYSFKTVTGCKLPEDSYTNSISHLLLPKTLNLYLKLTND